MGHALNPPGTTKETGALAEAFSDWVGITVQHSQGINNWTIGENAEPGKLRSLQTPGLYGDLDICRGPRWVPADRFGCPKPNPTNDGCGVHRDNGVANPMFDLLAEGGTHHGVTVTGLGIEAAIQIAVDAARNYWAPTATFASTSTSMMQAATMTHGATAANQMRLAWNAVGVSPPAPMIIP